MIILSAHMTFPDSLHNSVVAIGNFDGVHRGHQIIFELARRRARQLGRPFVILTFDPHPRKFFQPDSPSFLITPPTLKIERCRLVLADTIVTLSFDRSMANRTPQAFIDDILKNKLHVAHVFVGRDFRFGHDRAGTTETILEAGINVTALDLMTDSSGLPYSSTRIRTALQAGQIVEANRLLGWPFEMQGTVIHGDQRGRTLGYPTANLVIHDGITPKNGIYAALVQIDGTPIWHKAAISLGYRPMFAVDHILLEAHLLDFDGDLYGKTLRIRPIERLRDEMRFDDLIGLTLQIRHDCQKARQILTHVPLTA